jgi:hypothetical protein
MGGSMTEADRRVIEAIVGGGEMPQVFPPVQIRRAHDPRLCPKCGYRLREGDWPFCQGGVGHEPVQQGVGHPVVMDRRKD